MNLISHLNGATTILVLLLLTTPSIFGGFKDKLVTINPSLSRELGNSLIEAAIHDTDGNKVDTNTSYIIIPGIHKNGLEEIAGSVSLVSLNKTCPYHVSLGQTPVPVRFKPILSESDDSEIYTGLPINIKSDNNPGNDNCSESNFWQVDYPLGLNSRGYVKTGGSSDNSRTPFSLFRIKSVEGKELEYIIQFCGPYHGNHGCQNFGDLSCTDPDNSTDLIFRNYDFPLHVKFQKV